MRCREAERAITICLGGALPADARARLEQHLSVCPACRDLMAAEQQIAALLACAPTVPAAPDLWARFQTSLAREIDCRRAAQLIPGRRDDGVVGADRLALEAHLTSCARCTAEVAAYESALAALDRAGEVCPAVDLWPEFVRRLETQSRPTPLWLRPVWAPALGVAMAALVLVAALRGTNSPVGISVEQPGVRTAHAPVIGPETARTPPAAAAHPVRREPVRRTVRRASTSRARAKRRLPEVASDRFVTVRVTHRGGREIRPGEEVRLAALLPINLDLSLLPAPSETPGTSPTLATEPPVIDQVGVFLEMVAGYQERATDPFGGELLEP